MHYSCTILNNLSIVSTTSYSYKTLRPGKSNHVTSEGVGCKHAGGGERQWLSTQTKTHTALDEPNTGAWDLLGLPPPPGCCTVPGEFPNWEPGLEDPGSTTVGWVLEVNTWMDFPEVPCWNSGGGGRCIQLYCLFSTGTPHLSNSMYCAWDKLFMFINNIIKLEMPQNMHYPSAQYMLAGHPTATTSLKDLKIWSFMLMYVLWHDSTKKYSCGVSSSRNSSCTGLSSVTS